MDNNEKLRKSSVCSTNASSEYRDKTKFLLQQAADSLPNLSDKQPCDDVRGFFPVTIVQGRHGAELSVTVLAMVGCVATNMMLLLHVITTKFEVGGYFIAAVVLLVLALTLLILAALLTLYIVQLENSTEIHNRGCKLNESQLTSRRSSNNQDEWRCLKWMGSAEMTNEGSGCFPHLSTVGSGDKLQQTYAAWQQEMIQTNIGTANIQEELDCLADAVVQANMELLEWEDKTVSKEQDAMYLSKISNRLVQAEDGRRELEQKLAARRKLRAQGEILHYHIQKLRMYECRLKLRYCYVWLKLLLVLNTVVTIAAGFVVVIGLKI